MLLPFLIGIKNCLDVLGTKLSPIFRCKSSCCNNINVYNPRSCIFNNQLSNMWVRKQAKRSFSAIYLDENTLERRVIDTIYTTPKN